MATIKIIGGASGSFPEQDAKLVDDLLIVRPSTGGERVYPLKHSIVSLRVISQEKDDVVFDIKMNDGGHFRGEANKQTVSYLTKIASAKPPARKKISLIKTLGALIALFFIYEFVAGGHKAETIATAPSITPLRQQTPEEIARQEKVQQEARNEREKTYRAQDAAKALDGIKASEILLDGAEVDLKRGHISGNMDLPTIGVMLGLMDSTAQALQQAWDNHAVMPPPDIHRLQALEARLSAFQQQALPKMRSAFRKQAAEMLWEHDVTVSIGGSGDTVLTLLGFWFAAHANIKMSQEKLNDITQRLRFKIIRFSFSKYSTDGTEYKLPTPGDGVIANYTDAGFHRFSMKEKKQ